MNEEEITLLREENGKLKEEIEEIKSSSARNLLDGYSFTSDFAKSVVYEMVKTAKNQREELDKIIKSNPDAFAVKTDDAPKPYFTAETVFEDKTEIKPVGFWRR